MRTATPLVTCSSMVDCSERATAGGGQPLLVHLVEPRVLAQGGEEAGGHPLQLEAERHHDVGTLDSAVEVRLDGHAGQGERLLGGGAGRGPAPGGKRRGGG